MGNKIIVSDAPNVFLFTDDGTGHSMKKELLFTGIKGVQHDHAIHTFVFGPDGKIAAKFHHNEPDRTFNYDDVEEAVDDLLKEAKVGP